MRRSTTRMHVKPGPFVKEGTGSIIGGYGIGRSGGCAIALNARSGAQEGHPTDAGPKGDSWWIRWPSAWCGSFPQVGCSDIGGFVLR